jgi:hypothetical protein
MCLAIECFLKRMLDISHPCALACRLYDGFQAQLEKVQHADPSKDPVKLKQVR